MSAIHCSKCGQELADPARPCPQCGHQHRLLPEWLLWFDIVVLILAVVGFIMNGSPMMAAFGAGAFLYMLYDLGQRNAQGPKARTDGPDAEDEAEGSEEEGEEEEFIPEEEDDSTCTSCGASLEEGAKFCGTCGRRVRH